MSPVFRHGRLRLYLLKLLDEAPRHGYEVIRLLQDRFMGVYSPSPGTIYPRLARLEDDGLVTHDEVDGRKVYRITEKGREEIRARLDDLAELEEELTESVRDIAREVSEDVRDTVRSLREEITWAARDIRRDRPGREDGEADPGAIGPGDADARDDAQRIRDEARQAREGIKDAFRSQRRRGRPGSAGKDWGAKDWGGKDWGAKDWGRDWHRDWGKDWGKQAGLDKMASEFARDLSHFAGHAGDLGENALGDLRGILADALTRIRDEVLGPARDAQARTAGPADDGQPEAAEGDAAPGNPDPGSQGPATP
jgi:DNA-binding PadR family transcriptional regulator